MNEKIKQIVAENLGVEPKAVTPEAALLDDLGADSLDIIELVLYVEEEFGVEIPDEVSDGILTVKDLIEAVEAA